MYKRLSDYYDEIFPFEQSIAEKLEREFPNPGKGNLLDVACGTGTYTIRMARKGHTLLGTDLDQEMIEQALKKASREKDSVREHLAFRTGDMRQLSSIISQAPFTGPIQGVYCLGNSLPHLPSKKAVQAFFVDVKKILQQGNREDGRLLLQTVNFDRLPEEGEVPLPSIRNEEGGILFTRSYRMKKGEGKIKFITELRFLQENEKPSRGESIIGEVDLLRTESDMLLDAAQRTGFSDFHISGSYDGEEFLPSSSFLFLLSAKIPS